MKSFQPKTQDISRTTPAGQRRVNPEAGHLAQLTAKLRQNLGHCVRPEGSGAKNYQPSVDAVHDVRTGTRRIEAILDSIQRSMPGGPFAAEAESVEATLAEAIARWRRLLKKIRRSAGAVRDLDVHRDLLADLMKSAAKDGANSIRDGQISGEAGSHVAARTPLQKQVEDLDAWLKHSRQDHSQPLVDGARKWASKLDANLLAVTEALQKQPARRAARSAAISALEAFARLSSEMQQLHAENLHDFRKGAKKARYMAETGADDQHAEAVGKALKKLQDEIGDWHDWLVLAEEAHSALGDQGMELTARIEHERELHYTSAMKTAERMRGRLMGEWHASASGRRRISKPHPSSHTSPTAS
ncbi:CHAD domain-containing protein [Silvibacterium bohemicum]|uniref:CHAD domain-containing protein n=1 Tax=Silvibacterium bohemicum TaxID=1577686 RepID=A0A841JZP2_9BACT|nr:CHAD domain-containing protein [Silvibacterium bohemicum]MBB6146115.1 CHAD domain-containing protein [Silvibacterium bohemicum]